MMKIRNCVRVILLNDDDQLLLLLADDPSTTTVDGRYNGPFWFLVGGEIEANEMVHEAALREIFEETGINSDSIELGPIVWYGQLNLILNGVLTRLYQQFIVARTKVRGVHLDHATNFEREVIKDLAWFSLDDIKNSGDVIYPLCLPLMLPEIIAGHYPPMPHAINLEENPKGD